MYYYITISGSGSEELGSSRSSSSMMMFAILIFHPWTMECLLGDAGAGMVVGGRERGGESDLRLM